jgi:uncharacterized protein YdhG (YjbR/CyaY superfamily)
MFRIVLILVEGFGDIAPRIAAESPQRARSASVVRARTCSKEPEFGAQINYLMWTSLFVGVFLVGW